MEKNELFKIIIGSLNQPLWENWYLKEKIGEGSFSVVYRIEATRLGRTDQSALKIEPIVADGQIFNDEKRKLSYLEKKKANVVNESNIMVKLKGCPNIVQFEDEDLKELYIDGNFEGYYFLIRMECLTNVYALMKQNKFDYSEKNVIELIKEIGNGIATAHMHNIIHRDIKPSNFFVSDKKVYKLGDFNISKETDFTHTFAGTEGYIAPEIYRARSNATEQYTAQADIYSFGISVYQMLNDGMLPFENTMLPDEAMSARMSGQPLPAPCKASPELAKVILKACAFEPKDRYSVITDMLKDIDNIEKGLPVSIPEVVVPVKEEPVVDENATVYADDTNIDANNIINNIPANNTINNVIPNNNYNNNNNIADNNNSPNINNLHGGQNNITGNNTDHYNNNNNTISDRRGNQPIINNPTYPDRNSQWNIDKNKPVKTSVPGMSTGIVSLVLALVAAVFGIIVVGALLEYFQNAQLSNISYDDFTTGYIPTLALSVLSMVFGALSIKKKNAWYSTVGFILASLLIAVTVFALIFIQA